MKYKIIGHVEVEMEKKSAVDSSRLNVVDFNLDLSPNLNRKDYFTEDALPNARGTKMLTTELVIGLGCNIHQAHEQGYWDSAEHFRWIIAELEKLFVATPTMKKSEFGKEDEP